MSQFCEHCGAQLPDDAKFCDICGAKIEPAAPGAASGPAYTQTGNQAYQGSGFAQAGQTGSAYGQSGSAYNAGNNYAQPGGFGAAPQTPGGKGPGGIPKAAIIGGAAGLLVLCVAGFLIFGGKKDDDGGGKDPKQQEASAKSGKKDDKKEDSKKEDSKNNDKKENGKTDSGKKDSGKGETEIDPKLLEAGVNALTGGVTSEDIANVKIPKGAELKEDADLLDFIGDYKGEIQMTKIEGYESFPNLPKDFPEIKKDALKNPRNLNLRIEEDGSWDLIFSLVGIMDFDSDDYDDPEEFTPQEIDALLITTTSNGMYHCKIDKSFEEKGTKGHIKMDHVGAYCVDGDDRMISGTFSLTMNQDGKDVSLASTFVVHKLTEDFAKEERDVISSMNETSGAETTAEESTEESTEAESKAEIETVRGGQWAQLGSGAWVYELNGKIVKNSWVESDGVYYYVDEDGYMLKNTTTPDGYYVGADGAYDPNAVENGGAGSSSSSSAITGGAWDQLEDGTWLYKDASGEYVKSTWVKDGEFYYYIGPDGSMIKENYSPDGYWMNEDGVWDTNWPQRTEAPELKAGKYVGMVNTWEVKLGGGSYGKATNTYTEFGGTPQVYTLTRVGSGSYVAQDDKEPEWRALISIMDDGKTIIVSQAGLTERCTLK